MCVRRNIHQYVGHDDSKGGAHGCVRSATSQLRGIKTFLVSLHCSTPCLTWKLDKDYHNFWKKKSGQHIFVVPLFHLLPGWISLPPMTTAFTSPIVTPKWVSPSSFCSWKSQNCHFVRSSLALALLIKSSPMHAKQFKTLKCEHCGPEMIWKSFCPDRAELWQWRRSWR